MQTVLSSGNRSSTPTKVSASTSPSFTPGHTTTWPCTSIPASSSKRSHRSDTAPRRFCRIEAPHLGIGGVDRHVQRGQPLGDHPLVVELGETGESGEVPVQERQAVVVVLEVQRPAHPPGQLVDETELAVVVAGLNPVEHSRVDVGAERLTVLLGHRHRELLAVATHHQRQPPSRRRAAATGSHRGAPRRRSGRSRHRVAARPDPPESRARRRRSAVRPSFEDTGLPVSQKLRRHIRPCICVSVNFIVHTIL